MVMARLFSGAALVLALACSAPEEGSSREASSAGAAAGGARGRRAAGVPDATAIDLEAMLAPVPEYEGAGRNLFAYGAARGPAMAAVEAPPPEPEPVFEPAPPRPAPRPPAPAAARLNMKYAGFLEKTRPDGEKAKYAIFLDGNEILAGAEGETLMNRFTIVEIGLESVTVSASGSQVTQRIPLQSN
jgi:hypothetical protein